MKLIVHGRNIEITEWIHEYIEKKISKLEKYLPKLNEVRAELTQSNSRSDDDRYTFQITMWANKRILRAEESTGDIFASIDAATDKLRRQMKRVKGRHHDRRRTSASIAASTEAIMEAFNDIEEPEIEEGVDDLQQYEDIGNVVRRKEFTLLPMNEDEALEQLELLGHDFFVFFNPSTSSVNVMYRRRDGDYGLLQPQLA